MMSRLTTRYWFIAAIILSLLLLILLLSFSGGEEDGSCEIKIKKESWFSRDPGTLSNSRYGYSALTRSLQKKYNASVHLSPSYPDTGLKGLHKKFFLIINAPRRRWNEVEAGRLYAFLKRGGDVLLITPGECHLKNVKAFLDELGIDYKEKKPAQTGETGEWTVRPAFATTAYHRLYYNKDMAFPRPGNTCLK